MNQIKGILFDMDGTVLASEGLFDKAIKIFLYEKSELLKKIQKNKIKNSNIKWIDNFDSINKGPIIFFGNEFFDAIPIKQFSYFKKKLFEKFYIFKNTNFN